MRYIARRNCRACGVEFKPTGCSQPWCDDCADFRRMVKTHYNSLARTTKRGGKAGVGSGGMNAGECHSQNYRDWFLDDVYAQQEGFCAMCGEWHEKDPEFIMHHKDHDRTNNTRWNLELVCKRCHQIEHECWKNLPQFRKV